MQTSDITVENLIAENSRRLRAINAPFNPLTGFGSVGPRTKVEIPDFPIPVQWLPKIMLQSTLVNRILAAGSISAFLAVELGRQPDPDEFNLAVETLTRLRCLHDFPFWAATFIYVKRKGGGGDCLFRLTRPQRRFVELLDSMRRQRKPIRIILLKARQWGGSTTSQIYMMWLQLCHSKGLNSLIMSQTKGTSYAIRDMFDRAVALYPDYLLRPIGAPDSPIVKMENIGQSSDYKRLPPRNCKIRVGSYESPDAVRGDDYSLVHCSEVGLWTPTPGKTPDDVVRAATSGILLQPLTMIVYESTANGVANFFHREYLAAKSGESQFKPLFISWFDIDQYSIPFRNSKHRKIFAETLLRLRNQSESISPRREPGAYLWSLWLKGATLEALQWYVEERKKYADHSTIASEFPSDDIEAFVNSGSLVFSQTVVERLRKGVRPPLFTGEVQANAPTGAEALTNLHFTPDEAGCLQVWDLPDAPDPQEQVLDRYLTVVDVGGRGHKADWSVIAVFDRLYLQPEYPLEERRPVLVAQWRGHCDIDLLAWRAMQIAAFYHNSLLVIESNTLETHDRQRQIEGGDQSLYILNRLRDVYPNLYARAQSPDEIRQGLPRRYGFHTNTSTKPMIITSLIQFVRDAAYIERSQTAIDEYLQYERRQNGSYGAIQGAHDDVLMTRAIALHISAYEMPLPRTVQRISLAPLKTRPISAASI